MGDAHISAHHLVWLNSLWLIECSIVLISVQHSLYFI